MSLATSTLKRWPWRIAFAALAIIAMLAVVAARGDASESGNYRTAAVTTGDVTQTLTATGSIASASRSDLTFQVAGTVAGVAVKAGDTVAAGAVLATLDTSDLEDAITEAQDAVSEAQEALADDLDAQANGTSSSSSGSSGGTGGSAPSGGGSGGSTPGGGGNTGGGDTGGGDSGSGNSDAINAAEQAVKDAQTALLEQYQVATAALDAAKDAQANAQTVCAAFTDMESTDEGAADALTACQQATDAALAAQQDAADAQSALMDAADALNSAVTDLLNAVNGTTTASPAAYSAESAQPTIQLVAFTTSRVAEATDGGMGSTASGNSGGVPSAEDILADSAEVTAAQAELAVAQQQLEYATLTAPVGGTVVAVGFAAGDSVSAGDTTTAITVIADNNYLVNLSVTLSQARMLEVGQAAQLTLVSDGQQVDGTVSSVSNVNSGNSFSQSYAVTIAVPDPGFEIRLGTSTRMEITVASASGVLVVPTSAVADAAGDATVQVIGEDGTAQTVSVTVGAVGAELTEIASGLEAGQQVVLADLSVQLSGDDDDSSSTGGLLSGLGDDTSSDQDFQFPDGFQPPQGGFGGGGPGGGGGGRG